MHSRKTSRKYSTDLDFKFRRMLTNLDSLCQRPIPPRSAGLVRDEYVANVFPARITRNSAESKIAGITRRQFGKGIVAGPGAVLPKTGTARPMHNPEDPASNILLRPEQH